MGWFGYSNTGTCCCNAGQTGSACTLLSDNFDRADDTNLGADWNEAAGAAEIVSGWLLVNGANSQIIAANGNPVGPYTQLTGTLFLSAPTATARLFLGWANTSNYLYCTVQTGFLTVGVAGGASKTVAISLAANSVYAFTFCHNSQVLTARINGVECSLFGVTAPGVKHGLGCGTASAYFNDFVARRVADNCENCGAVGCVNCTLDRDWYADLTGWPSLPDDITSANPDFNCDECANLPAVYLLEQRPNCTWKYEERFCNLNEPFPPCQPGTLRIALTVDHDCLPTLTVEIYQNPPAGGGTCGNGINEYQQTITYTSATPLAPDGPATIELTKLVPLGDFASTVANGLEPCQVFAPPETLTLTRAA